MRARLSARGRSSGAMFRHGQSGPETLRAKSASGGSPKRHHKYHRSSNVRGKIIRIAKIFQVFGEYAQDIWLFLRHNGFSPFEDRARRLSHKTIIEAHTIEKGLALPHPKPHFGQDKIRALLDMN